MSKEKEVAADWKKQLPPGFRFMPSDEVLCEYYLLRKVNGEYIMPGIILDADVYQINPFQLPGMDTEEQYTYYFTRRERKYPNGSKSARGTKDGVGYWKMTNSKNNGKVPKDCLEGEELGKKNTLVYFLKSPVGQRDVKTNWIMHEYELADRLLASTSQHPQQKQFNGMVLCRIYHRGKGESTDDEEQKDNSRNEPKQADYTNNREPLLPPPPPSPSRQQQQQQQQQQLRHKLQSPSKRKFEANESSITSHPHVANISNFYGTNHDKQKGTIGSCLIHEHKQVNYINNQETLPSQPPLQHQRQQLLRPKLPSPPEQRFETNETITSHPHIAKKLKLYAGHDQQAAAILDNNMNANNGFGQENPLTYHIPLEMVQHIHSTRAENVSLSTEEENTRGILHMKTEENGSNDHPQFEMSHNIIRDECIPLVSENYWANPTEEWEEAVSNMPLEQLNYYMHFFNSDRN